MKRFRDTAIWDKEWYQQLPCQLKLLWAYMCDRCDLCGVWDANYSLASYQIGVTVDESDLTHFGKRVRRLPNGDIFLPDFITFQYHRLTPGTPMFKAVLRKLREHGLEKEMPD